MKKVLFLLVFSGMAWGTFAQTDGAQLFDDSFLHEIRFESADTMHFIQTKSYQQLRMVVDGQALDSVGFKRKGNISAYTNPNKFAIKIKTNKYVKGREYDGIKEFTLHMNYQDPSMMREKLTYDICAAMGLYSLRTAFAKVYINNEYWGLYTLVEGKDEMYKQVFSDRDMDAIESLDIGNMCFISNTPSDYDVDNNGGIPTYKFENGNENTAWPRFAQMIDKANNTADNVYLDTVSKYLNLRDFFRYQAINTWLMNMDSYIGFQGNQIYVYDVNTQRWEVTPWDFNASFGLWDTNNTTPSSFPMLPDAITTGCIASKLNSIPTLKNYYLEAMCTLNQTVGDTTAFFAKIDQWKAQIQQAVYTDTRKHISNADFDRATSYGFHPLFGDNQPALKTFIAQRLAVIKQGLSNENYTCAPVATHSKTELSGLRIFPNPTADILQIQFEQAPDAPYEVTLFNTLGQRLQQHQNTPQLSLATLTRGWYLVTVTQGKQQYTVRIFKS